mmetsp:Transcript_94448/g.266702  ORF Transcript_94448/g.266702 Transcript_94448/m.266702 type:complete len:336 (+) Transcript_94448:1120-2127(+)
MSLEDISPDAALKNALESSGKRPERFLRSPRASADQDAKVLVNDVNWPLESSRSLGMSKRLSSERKSSCCKPSTLLTFCSRSATCCGEKAGKRIKTSRPTFSTSSADWADCMRDMSASNSMSARVRVSARPGATETPGWLASGPGKTWPVFIIWCMRCCEGCGSIDTACLDCETLPCKRSSIFCTESSSFFGFTGSPPGRRNPLSVKFFTWPGCAPEACTAPCGWDTKPLGGGTAAPCPWSRPAGLGGALGSDPRSARTSMEARSASPLSLGASESLASCCMGSGGGGGGGSGSSTGPLAARSARRWSISLSKAGPSSPLLCLCAASAAACCCFP